MHLLKNNNNNNNNNSSRVKIADRYSINHGFKLLNVLLNSFVRENWLNNISVIYQILSSEMLRSY
jgi:hypothetical protein